MSQSKADIIGPALLFWVFQLAGWPLWFLQFGRRKGFATEAAALFVSVVCGFPLYAMLPYWLSRFYHPLPLWLGITIPSAYMVGFIVYFWRLNRDGFSLL